MAGPDAFAARRTGVRAGARVAERRQVSILFVDLVSFTELAADRDPEEVRDLLDRYFETCRSLIARYGGAVEKFIGDAVMAVWGAPVAREDDAERAVRAALDLVEAVGSLGVELGLDSLAARGAVVTGEAAVTVGAVGQGIVAGDVVNTASRLQGAASPGVVLVDQATHRIVRGSIAFKPAGAQALRGKPLPVAAWEARHVVALRRGRGRSAHLEGPLVGRESTLAIVRELLDAVRKERTVRLLSIFGQAGVGKSRIVWELKKYVDGVVEGIWWHQASSPAYGEGLAFWALAEMVRARAGIGSGERPEVARRRLAACLARFVPLESERRWIAPFLAALVGLGPATGGEREEEFAAWRTFFERIGDQGTTVLVFDDLHRADAGLLDFVDDLVERSTAYPLFVVTVARPELRERRPEWGMGRRGYVGVSLEPLPRAAMTELLVRLAPGLPADLTNRILDRAAGIPLYAAEFLRMLVDRGELAPAADGYEVRRALDRLDVPESLHALVAARLDSLDPDDRALLHDAAILGDTFPPAALAAVSETTAEAIEPGLRRLVRRELLARVGDDRTPGSGRLRFVEWLVREVAYGTLSLRDRRTRHLAAATYYESLGDPEVSDAIANHVLGAYRSDPRGMGDPELARRAVGALRTAAERASALHAPDAALAFLLEALAVAPEPAQLAGIREHAAAAAQALARLEEAETYARSALEWYRQRGDRAAMARTAARLGSIQVARYDAAAIDTMRAVVDELRGEHPEEEPAPVDDPAVVGLLAGLARACVVNGRMAEAIAWADQALAGADRLRLVRLTADALAAKGAALLEERRTTEGVALLRAALTVAEDHGLVVSALRARSSLAVGLLADDPRAAFVTAGAGLAVARRFGFRDSAVRLASNWAEAALEVGEWDAAIEVLTELEDDRLPITDRVDLGGVVALILAWRGDPMATDRFDALAALLPSSGEQLAEGVLLYRRSIAGIALGRPAAAQADAEAAMDALAAFGGRTAVRDGGVAVARAALWNGDTDRLARAIADLRASGLGGRWVEAICRTLDAGLAARLGDAEAAAEHYAEASAEWRQLDLPLQLALCRLEAATFLPAGSDEAAAAREEARATLEGLGARAFLDRLSGGFVPGNAVAARSPRQPTGGQPGIL
ncbi:MAG TPA: adenylate/guanylate cyclase domain-containing protein [Candidatus Limnocylindrales bacterium]